ncbi:PBP1A family penicillin-binding protein [Candidatus Uhrbacteria bacterium]|nr:PBP1A family penicillin-binding protein [Candidatus Uhrbacteria bacterium]
MDVKRILSQIQRFAKKSAPFLKIGSLVLIAVLVVGLFGFTLFAAWVSRDLPDPNSLISREVPQSTKIYDRTGTVLLYEIHGDERRTLVKIEDIPDYAKWATIAIEDKGFYEHHGVYWQGLIRAVLMSVIKGQRIQGTSTLTQQFVKLSVLTNERSLTRKLKELIVSVQLEQRYTKDQILQLYFNEIPYGSTLYGIESASQAYFGKTSKDLTLDEAALLAAIPQRPDFFNPYGAGSSGDNRERLIVRQHYILDLMAEQGYIKPEEASAAKAIKTLEKLKPRRIADIKAPHFVMYVRSLLTEKYGQRVVEQGGLKVITTLSWDMQQIGEEEVVKGVEARGEQYDFTNAALVAIDPKTGQIQTMVGSKDFFDNENDGQVNVTLRPRQPGSSFKPIVYAAAFARGYLPQTQVWDVNTVFRTDNGRYEPKNYDLKERGPVSLRMALQGSLNIPAVEILYLVGVGRVLDFAEDLGYTTLGERSRFGLSLVLGGGEVKPLEHAAAYASFAADGIYRQPSAILKVEDPDGNILEEWKPPEDKRVMDEQVARLTNDVLSDNNARAYVFGGRNSLTLDRPAAAKTGTTNDYHDAWTAGYTPNLATVVWVGNNNNDEMKRGADGSIIAAPIWQSFMKRAVKDMPVERFVPPTPPSTSKPALLGTAFEKTVKVNKLNGKIATDLTPPEFIEERKQFEAHSILYYIDKDDPTGPPPANPADDPQFGNWESAVKSWVERTQWHATSSVVIPEPDDQFTDATRPSITVLNPVNNGTLSSRQFNISVSVSSPRIIRQVEAYINDTLIGSSLASPFTIQATIPNRIPKGYHFLKVKAYDEYGLSGEVSQTINLLADEDPTQANITLLAPQSNELWSRQTFPKTIKARLENPTAYARVDAAFIGTDNIRRLVGSVINPTSEEISIVVPAGPPIGPYTLEITTERSNGNKQTIQSIVNITE